MNRERVEVPHPGIFIREELEARGWSQRDLSFVLGTPEQAVNYIIAGKRGVSAEMAKGLGVAFGVAPQLFLNLQAAYDLSHAVEPAAAVETKAQLQAKFPVREMCKRGWLPDVTADLLERAVAAFFEEATPAFAPRRTGDSMPPAQIAWIYRVRQLAREMVVSDYSSHALRDGIEKLKEYRSAPESTRHVPRVLAECGVRFVVVENLQGGKIDGACTWLTSSKPVIGMSLRFDRLDNFWFTLRHEIEHVLNGDGQDSAGAIDAELTGVNSAAESPEERRANDAAADFCVPQSEFDSFYMRKAPTFSERDLLGFSLRIGVAPALVAGQLRRRTGRWDLFSKHLTKCRASVLSGARVDGFGQVSIQEDFA